jgi:RNA polymerase sigma factor (sigma-70 family)
MPGRPVRSSPRMTEQDPMESVLSRAARGDEEAWRVVVEAYSGRVYGLLRSQGTNPDLAEEITQSVFCTLAAKLRDYVEGGRFESWLFRIAMNRLRDEARRRRRHARPAGESEVLEGLAGAAPEPRPTPEPEQLRALRAAMAQLSPADREVIDLRHVGGMSFKQMADHLGEPLGTLLARHHRALAKLRGMLDPDLGSTP